MKDHFHTLPAPLILVIIKLLPDLTSLRHFVRASSAAAGTFGECYDEILETVSSSNLSFRNTEGDPSSCQAAI